jgi:hypothetical protein
VPSDAQYGERTLILPKLTETHSAKLLTRIRFQKGVAHETYNERWVQELVARYPSALPVQQIEPAFKGAVSVCMELPVRSGLIDNLYATPDGDLIVGETKLFRNPEARREVISQILDYAKDLSALSYSELEKAIFRAEAPDGSRLHPKGNLYQTVCQSAAEIITEELFIDAVSRNLARGRFLLLVIGDGIQEGAEQLAQFLQKNAGMHFTLALIEMAIFALPSEMGDGFLIQPRILAKTKNIEIVRIETGPTTNVTGPPLGPAEISKATTISEEKFYEQLAGTSSELVPQLKAFVARLEAAGLEIGFGTRSIIIRSPRFDGEKGWNVISITTSGEVWTDLLNRQADAVGLLDLSHSYSQRLASFIPGPM